MYEGKATKRVINRRQFIRLSGVAAAGGLLAACGAPSAAPSAPAAPAAVATTAPAAAPAVAAAGSTYIESPMTLALVQAGSLPPVDERLPDNPLVWEGRDVEAFELEQGVYGGTVRVGNTTEIAGMTTQGLARVSADNTTVYLPDMAESWEFPDDAMSMTFHLRPGHKWSDGTPFTANDMQWYFDNVIQSKHLDAPMPWSGMETTRDKIVAVDDATVRFEFAKPNPLFLSLARGVSGGEVGHWTAAAPHYIQQFHPDFTPISSYADPKEQFQKEVFDRLPSAMAIREAGRPVLWVFRPIEYVEAQLARLERNPFFHVVDRWNQQQPYVDFWENGLLGAGDKEVILLKLIAGETHWERRLSSVSDVPFLREQAEDTLDLIFTTKPEGAQQGIYFSAHSADEEMREVVRQADFRRALSIAVDRETINQTAYLGLGTVGHGFSLPGVYDPEIDGKWAQFDPDTANSMLDAIGLDKRDAEGFRTLPSGAPMTFVLGVWPTWHPGALESAEISAEGWNAIGVRTTLKVVDGSAPLVEDWNTGVTNAYVRSSIGGDAMFDLINSTGLRWGAVEYRWWQTKDLAADKRQGVEPPDDLKTFLELGDKVFTTLDADDRAELLAQRRAFMADTCWFIGMVQGVPHVVVANKKLRGVWGRTEEPVKWQLGAGDEEYWPQSWFWVE